MRAITPRRARSREYDARRRRRSGSPVRAETSTRKPAAGQLRAERFLAASRLREPATGRGCVGAATSASPASPRAASTGTTRGGAGVGSRSSAASRSVAPSSASRSSSLRPRSASAPAPTTASASSRLAFFSLPILSSTVPAATRRTTVTGRSCPMRWARSVAWSSTAGFHHGSQWMTVSAAVKFRPAPPAFREIRKSVARPRWKRSTTSCRSVVAPSRYS